MTPSDETKPSAGGTKPPVSETPTGIDLRPKPQSSHGVSRRLGAAALGVVVLVLAGIAWGGYRRNRQKQQAARDAGLPLTVTPAKADDQLQNQHPTPPLRLLTPAQLAAGSAPNTPGYAVAPQFAPCALDATGQPMRFNPQTGLSCQTPPPPQLPVVAVRSFAARQPKKIAPTPAEDPGLEAAWQAEQEAMNAPTSTKAGTASAMSAPVLPAMTGGVDPTTQLAAVSKALGLGANAASGGTGATQTDYQAQNGQDIKRAFLQSQHNAIPDNYLHSLRQPPLSAFEIKAGWDIPATLEQSLNSDLPGDLKALVSQNVYNTVTGQYLLIPQGSRLIGKYDSNISYAQERVQVGWNRIIFPDGSSIDLDGMSGTDAQGQAGLHDQVDHHYKRLVGMSVLTSMLMAAFAISQSHTTSVLAYPSATQSAESAVGQELTQEGAQITRRNLNVQPTNKVRAGYPFLVRVNKDMLFEGPYTPQPALVPAGAAVTQRTTFRQRN